MIYKPFATGIRNAVCALLVAAVFGLTPAATNNSSDYPDPVRARNGMVVSAHELASRAGVEVMQKGGNAVDAAVATGFALAVVYPVAGNIGGGGFMVIRFADGDATSFDYREKAPAAATRDMFLDENGDFVPERSQRGYLASGVPGAVAGMLAAHEKYGRLPLKKVLAPAHKLARKGFPLSRRHANRFNGYRERFNAYPATKKYFTKKDGSRYREGEKFVQKDLSKVIRRIQKDGRRGFYEGKTAEQIASEMSAGGGMITMADLAAYHAVEREPVRGTYRDHGIISMAPPSSGGVALMQLLNSVEPYDIGEMGHNSSATIHLMGESMRRAYADRAEWLGDPDFFDVPVLDLIAKNYSSSRMESFRPDTVSTSEEISHGEPSRPESTETTHYSVVDSDGNAVSVTTTLNGGYGSHVVIDGAGFFMNNEMDDFSAKPGVPNMFGLVGNEANAIEPGKRMLSSMTPTIVENTEGDLLMVVGTPGGATIITTVFQVIMNVVDHEMDVAEAVSSPRVHHQWLPDRLYLEKRAVPKDVIENLLVRGWEIYQRTGTSGRADAIIVAREEITEFNDPSGLDQISSRGERRVLFGGADPRGEDTAVGY